MADSRFAAIRLYIRKRWPFPKKIPLLLIVFLISLLLANLFGSDEISVQANHALFLLLFAAGLWITEAIPPFAVSILIIGFSIYFLDDIQFSVISRDWQKYISTWSSPIIWILLGGFFLAMGAQITQFDRKFSRYVLQRFGTNPYTILLGCMLVTGLLSMFMSNTATTAMMVTILIPIVNDLDKNDPFVKALFLGVAAAATVGGMGTVIGSPPNAIALGVIQNKGVNFGFLEWMMVGMPVAMILIFLIWLLLKSFYRTKYQSIELSDHGDHHAYPNRNTVASRRVVVITFAVTIGLWLTSPLHNIPVALVSFLPILILTVSGVVLAEDLRLVPWDTLILVAGGLTLGIVISDSGLADFLVGKIPVFDNIYVMLIILGLLTATLSNIMSNTAAASVLIPVGASFLPDQVLMVAVVIGLSASTALFLPISTPPNAIAYSSGFLKQSDFRFIGLVAGLAGPVIILVLTEVLMSFWPM